MAAKIPLLRNLATQQIMQDTIFTLIKLTQNIKVNQPFHLLQFTQQKTTYRLAKNKLNKLEAFAKQLLERLEGKCDMMWIGVLTEIWDEIDHINLITSWDYGEHMSDYHGLEDGCNCFNEASDSIMREMVRLLLHTSFVGCLDNTSTKLTSYDNALSPPSKKRKMSQL